MNIVVLDGFTMNPGDLSWNELEKLGTLKVYDRTSPEQLLERAADAEAVLTNKTVLNAAALRNYTLVPLCMRLSRGVGQASELPSDSGQHP